MRNYLKGTVLRSLINTIPFPVTKKIGSCKLLIIYYHIVKDQDIPHVRHLYKFKQVKQFIADLNFLQKNYSPIELSDVILWTKNKKAIPPNCFLLTFDDGFREIFDIIAPLLLEKNLPATFFISSAFLDNLQLSYQHKASLLAEKISKGVSLGEKEEINRILTKNHISYHTLSEGILKVDYSRKNILNKIAEVMQVDFQTYLNESKPYLTSDQVTQLINWGFSVGAHSIDHPYYSNLSEREQLVQTIESVKKIRQTFGLDYGAFAFPHNDQGVSRKFFTKVRETGLVDITFGTGGMLDGDLLSHKQRVSLENPILPAKAILKWQYMRKFYNSVR